MTWTKSSLLSALDRLAAEYRGVRDQPHKTSFELGGDRFFHALPARLRNGTVGCKSIWIDEKTGRVTGSMFVARPNGTGYTLDVQDVTHRRCAMMAVFCALQVFEPDAPIRLGVVGHGRIGRAAEQALRLMFSVEDAIVLPSPRAGLPRDPAVLRDADLIVTAASVRREDWPLRLSPDWRARAYVAFDSGFTLGPDFRSLRTLSDNPGQLLAHWRDEFPYDPEPPPVGYLTDLGSTPVAFYSYGIGLADLVVAEEMVR